MQKTIETRAKKDKLESTPPKKATVKKVEQQT